MDRHGLLAITRKVGAALRERASGKKKAFNPQWRWNHDVIVCPELPCFACHKVVKTNVVMFFNEARKQMIGQFQVKPGGKVYKGPIYHTHAYGQTGGICTGNAKTLLQLLYNPPRSHGQWDWDVKMVKWYHRYAEHNCPEMEQWWATLFPTQPYPWDGPFKALRNGKIKKSHWELRGTPEQGLEVYEE